MADEKPRGYCPACGRSIQLRKDGMVRAHGEKSDAWPPQKCRGCGEPPVIEVRGRG